MKVAGEAEKHGWDGFFLWDHIVEWKRRVLLSDSFTVLAAIATSTERIRIGTTVTPLPRLKPWLAARQTATLDQLSGGRMILGVGLGTEETTDYARFGERAENNILSEMLDESLEIITGLWSVDVSSIGENITGFVRRCFYPGLCNGRGFLFGWQGSGLARDRFCLQPGGTE